MIAKDLISQEIAPLRTSQTGKDALALLNDFHVRHLPVVEGNALLGLISEEDIFHHRLHDLIEIYELSPRHIAAVETDHVFEVMRVMGENRLTVIPIVDATGNYVGLVSQSDLMRFFSETTSFTEPGGVLVVEMEKRDYSMSRVASIVESEGVSILSSIITSRLDSELLELTLKLNRRDLNRVVLSFERHEIAVKESFAESDFHDSLKERYESLMNYLAI